MQASGNVVHQQKKGHRNIFIHTKHKTFTQTFQAKEHKEYSDLFSTTRVASLQEFVDHSSDPPHYIDCRRDREGRSRLTLLLSNTTQRRAHPTRAPNMEQTQLCRCMHLKAYMYCTLYNCTMPESDEARSAISDDVVSMSPQASARAFIALLNPGQWLRRVPRTLLFFRPFGASQPLALQDPRRERHPHVGYAAAVVKGHSLMLRALHARFRGVAGTQVGATQIRTDQSYRPTVISLPPPLRKRRIKKLRQAKVPWGSKKPAHG